jgi:hypothetical protein
MNNPQTWPVIFVPVFVALVWFGAMHFVAWIGGWKQLAAAYRFPGAFDGYRKRFVSGELGGGVSTVLPCNYGASLTLGTNPDGLYMAVVPLFRIAHPPLFIPWSDITATTGRKLFFNFAAFTFRAAPRVQLRIARNVAEQLIAAAGAAGAPALQAAE